MIYGLFLFWLANKGYKNLSAIFKDERLLVLGIILLIDRHQRSDRFFLGLESECRDLEGLVCGCDFVFYNFCHNSGIQGYQECFLWLYSLWICCFCDFFDLFASRKFKFSREIAGNLRFAEFLSNGPGNSPCFIPLFLPLDSPKYAVWS